VARVLQVGLESTPDCEVVMVTDPRRALALVRESRFELVIADYMMRIWMAWL
jgi:CheY-like chemotaxis protein